MAILPERSNLADEDWAAVTTVNQFRALGVYGSYCRWQVEQWRSYRLSLSSRSGSKIDVERVRWLLVNSWNTERLLRTTLEQFAGPDSGFVAQWAFPQSYYSCFNSTLAAFAVSGFTETSHRTVRLKIAELASCGKLPKSLNVTADGGWPSVRIDGLKSNSPNFGSARLDISDFEEVKQHLISFFTTTRKIQLEDKKPDLKIRTKDGSKLKTSLNKDEWERVSAAVGKTSWLCLLYRKRIKANYRDIDAFLSRKFDTDVVLGGLVKFTDAFNLMNEIGIVARLSGPMVRSWMPKGADFVAARLEFIDTHTV